MKNIFIIYQRYIDEINNSVIIGGLQTYIENLVTVFDEQGYMVNIMQYSEFEFYKDLSPTVKIIGVPKYDKNRNLDLVKKAQSMGDVNNDILIFATTSQICKHNFKKSIAIQHGIYWDCETVHGKQVRFPIDMFFKDVQSYKEYKSVHKVNKIVCVDNNYVNWYRAGFVDRKLNYEVIPNFADVSDVVTPRHDSSADKKVKIIFARRFELIRGVELLPDIIDAINAKYDNVEFTLAGDGSYREFLQAKFANYSNVTLKKYFPSEAVALHKEYDIAIVPTIASEGTSLSLLEAMAAGCAVVCSDVGGMANIILDGYNGRIVKPRADYFVEALSQLIENDTIRKNIAEKAVETVKISFSKDKWKQSWARVIKDIESNGNKQK